jgi:hypothetical protein
MGDEERKPKSLVERRTSMRVISVVFVLFVLVSACGTDTSTVGDSVESQTPEMMAAALVELITENHGFSDGPAPFTVYLIQNRTDPSAVIVDAPTDDSVRPLTVTEMRAIEDAVSEYGTVRWIDDPAQWQTPDLTPTVEGAAILGVGEPVVEDQSGLVPVSMWCGGLCGTWLTYRLDLTNTAWRVTGIEGPIAIS